MWIFKYLFIINFCASPFGKDKKTKSKFFQFTSLINVILGNFFLFFCQKNLFFPKFLVAHRYLILTLGGLDSNNT